MDFGEKDAEEFDQVKVALDPVVELHVSDEFGVGGHVASWSVTTPRHHRLPNFIRTCRPTRW